VDGWLHWECHFVFCDLLALFGASCQIPNSLMSLLGCNPTGAASAMQDEFDGYLETREYHQRDNHRH
jgi:hypothetical protein